MFRIKICGITNQRDATAVVQAGADAVGLNFYPASPRFVDRDKAQQIREVLPPEIVKVGLFVNAAAKDVCQAFDELALDLIQLHGDEPPEFIDQLGRRPVMRAFRLGAEGLNPVLEYLEQCKRLKCVPRLVMIDALVKGTYGGTGETANWSICAQYSRNENLPPLVLAGGLTASGVESSLGQKDHAAVSAFVANAREAFGRV
jgi:phosphoribosylanthranilate isomerase